MNFEDVEDKVLDELKGQITYAKTIGTYAGQLAEDIEEALGIFPAIFIVYAGSDLEWVDGPNYNEKCIFTVFVAAKNLRGQVTTRKGDHGCYEMIKDVLATLTNKTFGLEMERLTPLKVENIYISKTMAAYGIDFQTKFDTTYSW